MSQTGIFGKHPNAEKTYVFDWAALTNGRGDSDWLTEGETISTKSVVADTGLTLEEDELTDGNTSITIKVSGGVAGTNYKVTATITTSADQTDVRTMVFRVK
jgi:hypothetical protein